MGLRRQAKAEEPIWKDAGPSDDEALCAEWIRTYVRPSKQVNHMHNSVGLWRMMASDTGADMSHHRFCQIMADEGYQPADRSASEWEFRISSSALRRRPNARVGGWQPSRKPYWGYRLG